MTTTTEIRDELGEQLIEKGLVPNSYHLSINHGLTVPYDMELPAPWNLPSRLFRFPIEVSEAYTDRPRAIGMLHPALIDHPFVQHVIGLGFEVGYEGAPNPYGYSKCRLGSWWHAVDLMTAGLWQELLDTRQFTTEQGIARAVSHACRYSHHDDRKASGYITTKAARTVMRAIGTEEPSDRASTILGYSKPSACRQEEGAESWPINVGRDISAFAEGWAMIHGVEDGWFKHDRSGHLQWTGYGRTRYEETGRRSFKQEGRGPLASSSNFPAKALQNHYA